MKRADYSELTAELLERLRPKMLRLLDRLEQEGETPRPYQELCRLAHEYRIEPNTCRSYRRRPGVEDTSKNVVKNSEGPPPELYNDGMNGLREQP